MEKTLSHVMAAPAHAPEDESQFGSSARGGSAVATQSGPTDRMTRLLNPDSAEDILRYREGVETLMRLGARKTISNGIPAHAAILFETFFRHAKESVKIFCESLKADVFGTQALLDQAAWAMARGVTVQIIVQSEPQPSGFLSLMKSGLFRAVGGVKDSTFNFAVMDGRAVRIEKDRTKCEAVASMNDPEVGKVLSASFDRLLLTSAVPITATEPECATPSI
ncbi:MAG TPA: hypothetical protein VGO90_10250 [Chthoniobacteraceae bacterium]|jgi:hypothetical protein|nr:hypothetical protein [Chthoniobacteraceae bacterium]